MARANRLAVARAIPGRMVGKRFVASKNPRRNIAEGFHDSKGVFHPIRASADYDPSRGGDATRKGKKKAKKAKAKAKPRRKPAKKKRAVKRASARKGGKKRKR
jgi:hypothetical protein